MANLRELANEGGLAAMKSIYVHCVNNFRYCQLRVRVSSIVQSIK